MDAASGAGRSPERTAGARSRSSSSSSSPPVKGKKGIEKNPVKLGQAISGVIAEGEANGMTYGVLYEKLGAIIGEPSTALLDSEDTSKTVPCTLWQSLNKKIGYLAYMKTEEIGPDTLSKMQADLHTEIVCSIHPETYNTWAGLDNKNALRETLVNRFKETNLKIS